MATFAALGAMATACQGVIEVIQPTGNKVVGSLMLLVIAESGERKTKVEQHFFEGVRSYQLEKINEYKNNYKKYESALYVWETQLSEIKSNYKKSLKDFLKQKSSFESHENLPDHLISLEDGLKSHFSKRPDPPSMPKLIYEDATPESLLKGLHFNSSNACLLSSEGGCIFDGRVLKDLPALNKLWDGGQVVVDRAVSDSFILDNARLSMLVMVQDSVINKFLDNRGNEARGNGFLSRLLVVKPKGKAGHRNVIKRYKMEHSDSFNKRIKGILHYSEAFNRIEKDKMSLSFTQDASDFWNSKFKLVESEMGGGNYYEYHKDHASKLMDNVSRISAIIHFFEKYKDILGVSEKSSRLIGVNTLKYAFDIAIGSSYYFRKFIAPVPDVVIHAEMLVGYLYSLMNYKSIVKDCDRYKSEKKEDIRKGVSFSFNRTDVKRMGPSVLRDNKRFNSVILLLKKIGHIEVEDNNSGHGATYKFCEAITGHKSPDHKNGISLYVRNLPRYDQQYFGLCFVSKKKDGNEVLNRVDNGSNIDLINNRGGKKFYILVDKYD